MPFGWRKHSYSSLPDFDDQQIAPQSQSDIIRGKERS